jgi:cytoskeletal protein CcmA (bactofilin family)
MRAHGFRTGAPNSAYIGEGVTVKGAIFVPEEIVVDGVVEGDVTAQSIRIGASGTITGKVVSTDLDVSGTLGEDAVVKEFLVIRSSGKVKGHVNCGDVEVEKGAVLGGGILSVSLAAKVNPVNDNQRSRPAENGPETPEADSVMLNAAE